MSAFDASVDALRAELAEAAVGVPDEQLAKFLEWKPDVARAAGRFRAHCSWRAAHRFAFDDPPLLASGDPQLRRLLESEVVVAPDGMVDKQGASVLVGRLRNNDMSDGRTPEEVCRMALYTIDRVLETSNARRNGIAVFHDMNGLQSKNFSPAIPKLLFGALIGNLPVRIKGVYILNAPLFFRVFFSVFSLMLPTKIRERVRFVSSMSEVHEVIDQEQLLSEHGGSRTHDTAAWVSNHVAREASGELPSRSLMCCVPSDSTPEAS
jgi:hypothetical protein